MSIDTVVNIVLAAVDTFMKVEPVIARTVTDFSPYAVALYQQLTGQQPTDDQRAIIRAGIEALFARLETPLPPAQPGDPDYVKPTE